LPLYLLKRNQRKVNRRISMSNSTMAESPTEVSFYDYKGRFKGILSWILSTDHKRIGLMYLIAMLFFFFVAVALGVLMKLEMLSPGETIMAAKTYNSVFTLHGVIMIFLFIIPGIPAVFWEFHASTSTGCQGCSVSKNKSHLMVYLHDRRCF